MALLNILKFQEKRLNKVAKPVEVVDDRIRKLVRDMADTMYAAPGVGLAATQVDVHKRIIVIDISAGRDELKVFINPELLVAEGESDCEEGCLSGPGYYDKVRRAPRIPVRAQDESGGPFELSTDGMLAVCVQHE